ncbi:hypothetical protein EV702DRAFT_1266847 [Suillus placidus]|uniref:Uncharacterized protein n=1 Tax=Suillus placidus TaxID=48579 RepID=A0A9P7A1V5_9AGAM|nr:hypothetical protein EV702DRAFT_1266847 [Suillus placidus]
MSILFRLTASQSLSQFLLGIELARDDKTTWTAPCRWDIVEISPNGYGPSKATCHVGHHDVLQLLKHMRHGHGDSRIERWAATNGPSRFNAFGASDVIGSLLLDQGNRLHHYTLQRYYHFDMCMHKENGSGTPHGTLASGTLAREIFNFTSTSTVFKLYTGRNPCAAVQSYSSGAVNPSIVNLNLKHWQHKSFSPFKNPCNGFWPKEINYHLPAVDAIEWDLSVQLEMSVRKDPGLLQTFSIDLGTSALLRFAAYMLFHIHHAQGSAMVIRLLELKKMPRKSYMLVEIWPSSI